MPESEQFSDYRQRILEVVNALAEIEGRYAVEVVNDLLPSPASADPVGVGVISDAESTGLRRA